MTHPIIPGAEPWSHSGGRNGALVLHGFTGNCNSMLGIAEALAAADFTVELPLLPGHGTHIDDMMATTFADWSAHAEATYQSLAARCDKVFVVGLSMGGTLTAWITGNHPEVVGAAFINAAVEAQDPALRAILTETIAAGTLSIDGIGSDIADPNSRETAYSCTPLPPLITMFDAVEMIQELLPKITCPVLILTSPQDHVVQPSASDHLAATVSGPVERVSLDRSYHVATLDYDRELVETSVVAFAEKVCA